MDIFGFRRRRQVAQLREKLYALHDQFHEEYEDATDAFNDLAAEVTQREDFEYRDFVDGDDSEEQLEALASRAYVAKYKMDMIGLRLEDLGG
jgi:hypothetical protein